MKAIREPGVTVKIKATISLNAALKKRAQIAALERGVTLGELVERGLLRELAKKSA